MNKFLSTVAFVFLLVVPALGQFIPPVAVTSPLTVDTSGNLLNSGLTNVNFNHLTFTNVTSIDGVTFVSAPQNSVLAGPTSGGAGTPSYQTAPTVSGANLTALPSSTTLYPAMVRFASFATSISAAQALSSAAVGVGNIVPIMNAVNTGELSFYQLQTGTPSTSSPVEFQPSDNASLVYVLVK